MTTNAEYMETAQNQMNICKQMLSLYSLNGIVIQYPDGTTDTVEFSAGQITKMKQTFAAARIACEAALDSITAS